VPDLGQETPLQVIPTHDESAYPQNSDKLAATVFDVMLAWKKCQHMLTSLNPKQFIHIIHYIHITHYHGMSILEDLLVPKQFSQVPTGNYLIKDPHPTVGEQQRSIVATRHGDANARACDDTGQTKRPAAYFRVYEIVLVAGIGPHVDLSRSLHAG